jgi:hypothetical protein
LTDLIKVVSVQQPEGAAVDVEVARERRSPVRRLDANADLLVSKRYPLIVDGLDRDRFLRILVLEVGALPVRVSLSGWRGYEGRKPNGTLNDVGRARKLVDLKKSFTIHIT